MAFVKVIVYKLVGMLVRLHAPITVYGYVQLIVVQDVSKDAHLVVQVVHRVQILVVQNLLVAFAADVDLLEDAHHHVSIIVIRIVLDGDVDHSAE